MRIINEHGTFRLRWDITIAILIFISFLVIPFQFAFIHELETIGSAIVYSIDLFFIVNLFINSRTSYKIGGQAVSDPNVLINRYKKKHLFMDVLGAVPFEVIFYLLPEVSIYDISIFLWIRLVRLVRIKQLFIIIRRWQSHYLINPGYLRIIKFTSVIILLSHLIACSWYLAAFLTKFPTRSWAALQGIQEADIFTQYIRSIYWTVTTMTTVGYGDIVPHLNYEYVFSIVVMLTGASTYAFIIGNIASLISSIDSQKSKYWNNLDALIMYLKQRGVSSQITLRVQNYYEYRWEHHRGFNEDSLLQNLPRPMKLEVMQELTKGLLREVPLFKYCSDQLRNILIMSFRVVTYSPESFISRFGDKSNEIVFISKGEIQILNEETGEVHCEYTSGEYFGILSVMLGESRTASIRTKTFCETFILEAKDFHRIKHDFPEFLEVMKKISGEKSVKTNSLLLDGIII